MGWGNEDSVRALTYAYCVFLLIIPRSIDDADSRLTFANYTTRGRVLTSKGS